MCTVTHSVGGTNRSLLEAPGVDNMLLPHSNPFNREVLGEITAEWFATPAEAAASYKALVALDSASVQERRDAERSRAKNTYSWQLIAEAYESLLELEPLAATQRTRQAQAVAQTAS